MKKFSLLLISTLIASSLNATNFTYVYVEKGVMLPPLKDGSVLYLGTPLKIISDGKYEINGFVGEDKTKLYATKNLSLLLASSEHIKVDGDKGTLVVELDKKNTEKDPEEAWFNASETFYNKCTKCHAAKSVGGHTMIEWEALYGGMKAFSKPTVEEDALIVRFLKAFAKDGILKESEEE